MSATIDRDSRYLWVPSSCIPFDSYQFQIVLMVTYELE
jgi:hypothetical protein